MTRQTTPLSTLTVHLAGIIRHRQNFASTDRVWTLARKSPATVMLQLRTSRRTGSALTGRNFFKCFGRRNGTAPSLVGFWLSLSGNSCRVRVGCVFGVDPQTVMEQIRNERRGAGGKKRHPDEVQQIIVRYWVFIKGGLCPLPTSHLLFPQVSWRRLLLLTGLQMFEDSGWRRILQTATEGHPAGQLDLLSFPQK